MEGPLEKEGEMRKIVTTAVAAIAAIAASLTMAGMASASTGTPEISPEEAGYSATGAQFQTVSASVFLRNPEQYATEVGGYGHSVQLWSSGLVMVLGVSDTTAAGSKAAGFSPAVAVFDRGTHALLAASANGTITAQWCPAGGSCQPATSGGSFAVGVTVTERMHYNPSTGAASFKATDKAGDRFTATYSAGLGKSFKQARIGTEFSVDPWTAPSYTPPANFTKIAVYNNARLVTYSGHVSTLSSWWVHHVLEANTVAQSESGDWVAIPTNLYNSGASFQTWFVPTFAQSPTLGARLAPGA
jgi:hypothetical protein